MAVDRFLCASDRFMASNRPPARAYLGAGVCAPPWVSRSAARVTSARQTQSRGLGRGRNGLRLRGRHGAPANLRRLLGGLRDGAREEAGRRVKRVQNALAARIDDESSAHSRIKLISATKGLSPENRGFL